MQVAVSGSSGLVGTRLVDALQKDARTVRRLVRGAPAGNDIAWQPMKNHIDAAALEGVDAVVHLAGENIASGRWTAARKARLRDSRVLGTELLSRALAGLERKPRVLISASAIGYYGDRADEILSEAAPPGQGFLPDVCQQWEAATQAAADAGIRVVRLRISLVLSTKGGALAKMLVPFKMGLGGRVGSGRQYMSWITLDELVRVITTCINQDQLAGAVNAAAPHPVTNAEFTTALGQVLSRPTLFPVPAVAARLAFGEMADALLLASTRVVPTALQREGFQFQYPTIEDALRHVVQQRV